MTTPISGRTGRRPREYLRLDSVDSRSCSGKPVRGSRVRKRLALCAMAMRCHLTLATCSLTLRSSWQATPLRLAPWCFQRSAVQLCFGANVACQRLSFSTRRKIDTESGERIALLADGDAFGPDSLPGIFDALRPFGTTPVRNIYCREDLAGKWAAQLKKLQATEAPGAQRMVLELC